MELPTLYAFYYIDDRNRYAGIPDVFLYYSEEKQTYGFKPGRFEGEDVYEPKCYIGFRDGMPCCKYELLRLATPQLEEWHEPDRENWRRYDGNALFNKVYRTDPDIDRDSKDLLKRVLNTWMIDIWYKEGILGGHSNRSCDSFDFNGF